MTATAPELRPWWVGARSIRDDVAECLERSDTDMTLRLLIDGVNRIPEEADDAHSPKAPEQVAAIHDRLSDESAIKYLPEGRYAVYGGTGAAPDSTILSRILHDAKRRFLIGVHPSQGGDDSGV